MIRSGNIGKRFARNTGERRCDIEIEGSKAKSTICIRQSRKQPVERFGRDSFLLNEENNFDNANGWQIDRIC